MKGTNPFSFIIGAAVLIITAGAVLHYINGPDINPVFKRINRHSAAAPLRSASDQQRQAALTQPPGALPAAPARGITPASDVQGTIAIVLDDWGYTLSNVGALKEIPYPVTAAVLPNLKYSSAAARELSNAGKEIILHLPMEPMEKMRLEADTITVGMDDARIRAVVDRALDSVRFARGINNHMGSRATQDKRVMSAVIAELKRRSLFYLDSYTVASSVGPDSARALGVPYAQRDVFLDNELDPDAIRAQLELLKEKARVHGYAIGIGHDRKATIAVLREMMPKMAAQGYRFVPASALAQHKE